MTYARIREKFIPKKLGTADYQSLIEAFPFRLRLTGTAAITLFISSNIPDYLLPSGMFWNLLWIKLAASALFAYQMIIIQEGRPFSYYLRLTYAQVLTATIGTGAIVYLTGGCESRWALTPGFAILIAGLILPLPLQAISIAALIGLSGYVVPMLLHLHPNMNMYLTATHLFYYFAFTAIAIIGAYFQFFFTMEQNHRLNQIRRISQTLKERDEDLIQKNRELIAQTERVMEANRLKSEFLANISHELRTPLTGVIGFSSILAEKLENMPEKRRMIEQVLESGNQLLAIVDDLIDLSQIEAGKITLSLKPADVNSIVLEIVDSITPQVSESRRKVIAELDEDAPPVFVDRNRIIQAVFKIAQNAIKFTDEGGKITIGCKRKDGKVQIYISDDGMGMSEGEREIIFDRFRQLDGSITRRHGGLGIGLCIAKSIVELHGGVIDVESEMGKGSTFTLTLPEKSVQADLARS